MRGAAFSTKVVCVDSIAGTFGEARQPVVAGLDAKRCAWPLEYTAKDILRHHAWRRDNDSHRKALGSPHAGAKRQ